jgi:hypothetical protein
MVLNIYEQKVLGYLTEDGFSWDQGYSGFAGIVANTRLDRKTVRRACRSLARKGLTEFGKGLWNDDGEPAGSGYCATKAGIQYAADKLATGNHES